MDERNNKVGMGWIPDYPDFRDFTTESDGLSLKLKSLGQKDSIKKMLLKLPKAKPSKGPVTPPISKDLRPWFTPIENQETLGSCTAHAGVGLVEYFEKRAFSTFLDASRLFLYKVTRDLLGWTGDVGAYPRIRRGAEVLASTGKGWSRERSIPHKTRRWIWLLKWASNY